MIKIINEIIWNILINWGISSYILLERNPAIAAKSTNGEIEFDKLKIKETGREVMGLVKETITSIIRSGAHGVIP